MKPVMEMEDLLRDVNVTCPVELDTYDVRPEEWGRLMNVRVDLINEIQVAN